MRKNPGRVIFVLLLLMFFMSGQRRALLYAQSPEISIHYLGHSSFIIHFDNGLFVLTDYGTSNAWGYASPIYGIGSLRPDIMTFSHQHEDHYNPARIPDSVRFTLTGLDTFSQAGLEIKPVRVSETNLSNRDNSGFIFSYKGMTLVHLGDAQANIMKIQDVDNQNYLRQILPEKIDLLLMTIEGVSQFIPQAEAFVDFLQPKRIIPMHYWSVQYKNDFLAYLEAQNQAAGKNYRIDRRNSAKFALSSADTSLSPIQVLSLAPAPFANFTDPEIRLNHLELNDGFGNNNGRADGGETVSLVLTLINHWTAADQVAATLGTNDPGVRMINPVANLGRIEMSQARANADHPFTFTVSPSAAAHYQRFDLAITAAGGYATTDSFTIVVGTPTTLLIDDDDGKSLEASYTNLLIPEVWEVAIKGGPRQENLHGFKSVIWLTGDARETSLSRDEQAVISGYLAGGGRLLLCGQNIGFDLDGAGSAEDSLFFAHDLHAQFVADSVNATVVQGLGGDPITGGMTLSLAKTPAGEGRKSAPDVIHVLAPAEPILKYVPGLASAGLRYENKATGARLVYLAFGIEKIVGPKASSAATFVEKILSWLAGTTAVSADFEAAGAPGQYFLAQNFPNPFNPTTTIGYTIPQTDLVSLKVYNVLGAEITTLLKETQTAGSRQAVWNASDYPSGVYFYRLQAGAFVATRKFILLR